MVGEIRELGCVGWWEARAARTSLLLKTRDFFEL